MFRLYKLAIIRPHMDIKSKHCAVLSVLVECFM
jgi:hypothetical protein